MTGPVAYAIDGKDETAWSIDLGPGRRNKPCQAVFVAENGVVEESVLTGTHTGDLFGLPPTGRPVRVPLIIIFPMVNGEILGERLYFDLDGLRRQLAPPD